MKTTLLCFILFCFSRGLKAQDGDISGTVKDENRYGIPYVFIALVDSQGKAGKSVKSDFDGNYIINPLKPGIYKLVYSSTGYISQTLEGIIVSAEKSTFINLTLKHDPNYVAKGKKRGRR